MTLLLYLYLFGDCLNRFSLLHGEIPVYAEAVVAI